MPVKVTGVLNKASAAEVQRKMKQVAAAFKASGGGAGGMASANREVAVWLLRWVNENFKSQGGKVGEWKSFKEGGRRKRLRAGVYTLDKSAQLLQDTGRLRASFAPFSSGKNAGVASNLKYAVAHNEGLPSRNLPARRMIPTSEDKDVTVGVIKIYDSYIEKILRKQ